MRRPNAYWCSQTVSFANNYVGMSAQEFEKLIVASLKANARLTAVEQNRILRALPKEHGGKS